MVRWWMFPDPWPIETGSSGRPVGIAPNVFMDIDAALELAARYDIYYTFVLFDTPSTLPASWVTNSEHQRALGDVLGDLFDRYDGHPHVFAWEVFSEAEWEIWNGVVQEGDVRSLAEHIVSAIHENSSSLATMGSASLDGIAYWTDLNLDFYSPHWYDYMEPPSWCASCRTADSVRWQHGVSAPIVIGEFYAGPLVDSEARYQTLFDLGYAGAWSWSLLPDRTSDGMATDLEGAQRFAAQNSGVVGPSGQSSDSP